MKKIVSIALFALVLAIGTYAGLAQAGSTPITGWAWSSNIGWLQFNPAISLPVIVSTTSPTSLGTLSGYAWGSNIGWVSFNAADVTGCPTGVYGSDTQLNGCTPSLNFSTGAVTGWARILSSTAAENGGGWVQLSGANHQTMNTGGTGGVTLKSDGSIVGYAYEPSALGWLDFKASTALGGGTNPVCVGVCGGGGGISCSISSVPPVGGGTLSWTSANATTCTVSSTAGASNTTISTNTSGSQTISPITQTTTYSISCINNSLSPSSCSNSQTVTVGGATDITLKGHSVAGQANNLGVTTLPIKQGDKIYMSWTSALNPADYSCEGTITNGSATTWTARNKTTSQPNSALSIDTAVNVLSTGTHVLQLDCYPNDINLPTKHSNTVNVEVRKSSVIEI